MSQIAMPPAPTITGLRTPLWRHQAEAIAFARERRASMLAMAMGHGKSLVTLALLDAWDAARVLILCPKSVVAAWPEQFRRHVETPWTVCPLDRGTVAQRVGLAGHALASSPRVAVVVNYEAAIQPAMAKLLQANRWDVLVADEVHRLKSPSGVASRLAGKIAARSMRRLGLTGTPMPHGPLDLWAQDRALRLGAFGSSYTLYRAKYAICDPMIPGRVLRYQNLDDLERRLATFAYRSPEDAVELPDATHVTRTCVLSSAARKAYRELERDLTTTLEAYGHDATVTASTVLVKVLRLQQVTSGFVTDDDGVERGVDTGKAELLSDLLTDLNRTEPVVVFCRFRRDLDTVRLVAGDDRYRELSGRANDLAAWQAGDGAVLAVQIQAGGVGVDLTRARICVYYSKDYSYGAYAQSLARVHRPGQTRPVLYVHLNAAGTIDEKIEAALAARRDLVESLLEGLNR